jgi:hypothetical protein
VRSTARPLPGAIVCGKREPVRQRVAVAERGDSSHTVTGSSPTLTRSIDRVDSQPTSTTPKSAGSGSIHELRNRIGADQIDRQHRAHRIVDVTDDLSDCVERIARLERHVDRHRRRPPAA